MAKQKKSAPPKTGSASTKSLVPVKTAEAFVPTPAHAVRLRYKMGGG